LFDAPKKTYRDYKNKRDLIGLGANVMRWGWKRGISDDLRVDYGVGNIQAFLNVFKRLGVEARAP
jgi:hypothetical protein